MSESPEISRTSGSADDGDLRHIQTSNSSSTGLPVSFPVNSSSSQNIRSCVNVGGSKLKSILTSTSGLYSISENGNGEHPSSSTSLALPGFSSSNTSELVIQGGCTNCVSTTASFDGIEGRSISHPYKGQSQRKTFPYMFGTSSVGILDKRIPNGISSFASMPSNHLEENILLCVALDEERKKLLFRRVMNSFMLGALRRNTDRATQLQLRFQSKSEEAAARHILHALVLNCYKKTQKALEVARKDNLQLHAIVSSENDKKLIQHKKLTKRCFV